MDEKNCVWLVSIHEYEYSRIEGLYSRYIDAIDKLQEIIEANDEWDRNTDGFHYSIALHRVW